MTNQAMREWGEKMRATPGAAKKFIRAVMGPPRRELTGDEYAETMTLIRLCSPTKTTNNQHTLTEYYIVGNKEYHLTYFAFGDLPELEEILPD